MNLNALKRKIPFNLANVIMYTVLILFAAFCIFPLLWTLVSSLKNNHEIFESPWGLPAVPQFINYWNAWVVGNIGRYFFNSAYIVTTAVIVSLIASSMAAYAIRRMIWKLSKHVMMFFLLGVMIPVHATLIPLYRLFNSADMVGSPVCLIIIYTAVSLPMSIFILGGFFKMLPRELEEAAVIDGYSVYRIFWEIIIPLSKPAIATVTIFNFIGFWNELLFALVFMSNVNYMTLPVGLTNFIGRYHTDYTGMLAAIMLSFVPSLLIYIFLHENIIKGIMSGSLKE
jgi:raffinose/stachyose/melibiose transport system permease protein